MSCNKSFIPFCSAKLFFCVIPTSTASRDHVIQRESSPIYSHCFSLFWWSDCLIVGNQALVSIYFFILPNWLVIFFFENHDFFDQRTLFLFPFPISFLLSFIQIWDRHCVILLYACTFPVSCQYGGSAEWEFVASEVCFLFKRNFKAKTWLRYASFFKNRDCFVCCVK